MLYAHPHTQSCAPSRLFPHRCFSNFLTRPSSLHQKLSLSLGWVTSFIPLRPLESWTGLPRCEVEVLAAPYTCPLILTLLTPMTAAHCLLSEWEAVCSLPRFQESLSGLSIYFRVGAHEWCQWLYFVAVLFLYECFFLEPLREGLKGRKNVTTLSVNLPSPLS